MSIAVLGEALIDFIADKEGNSVPHLGGSPFNFAISMARQEMDVSYLPPLSNDQYGELMSEALTNAGVALPLRRRSELPTSLVFVTIDDQGLPAYRLYRHRVADKDTSFNEICDSIPSGTKVLHTGSLAITPSQLDKVTQLFHWLRERAILTSVDINIRLQATPDAQRYIAGVRSLLPLCDVVKASDEDVDALGLHSNSRAGAQHVFEEMDGGALVLTEGSKGVAMYRGGTIIESPAFPVDNVEDTVGAGDTFYSAFLAQALRANAGARVVIDALADATLHDALEFGCAAAAINVARPGCSPPTKEEVEAFVESRR